MLFTYVHLQNSFWYRYASVDCDLENLDTCVTNLIREYGDNYFLICGDLNSRVEQANPYVVTWFGILTVRNKARLSRVVNTASKVTGCSPIPLPDVYAKAMKRKASQIIAQ